MEEGCADLVRTGTSAWPLRHDGPILVMNSLR